MYKRLIFFTLSLSVIITGVFFYLGYLNGVDPRQLLPRFSLPSEVKLPEMPKLTLPGGDTAGADRAKVIYKWRNSEGVWQFTEQAPANMDGVELIELEPERNLVQSWFGDADNSETKHPAKSTEQPKQKQVDGSRLEIPNPYNPATIKKLFEDAKAIQQYSNDYAKRLEEAGDTP